MLGLDFAFQFQMFLDSVNQKFEWVWWIWFEITLYLLFELLLWFRFFFNKSSVICIVVVVVVAIVFVCLVVV